MKVGTPAPSFFNCFHVYLTWTGKDVPPLTGESAKNGNSFLLTRPEVRILRFVATRALGGIATDVHPANRARLHLDPAAPGEFSFLFANRGGFHRFLE
jgi:hypothetical protein